VSSKAFSIRELPSTQDDLIAGIQHLKAGDSKHRINLQRQRVLLFGFHEPRVTTAAVSDL